MRYLPLLLTAMALTWPVAAQADNIAACEVVILEAATNDDGSKGAELATFHPAAEFMASIYDAEDGHIKEIDGQKIRGVMCERKNIVPSLRDFPILATGIPFSLSNDFDSAESRLLTVYFKDGEFQHKYIGPDLSEDDTAALTDSMEIFNLQGHNLDK